MLAKHGYQTINWYLYFLYLIDNSSRVSCRNLILLFKCLNVKRNIDSNIAVKKAQFPSTHCFEYTECFIFIQVCYVTYVCVYEIIAHAVIEQ